MTEKGLNEDIKAETTEEVVKEEEVNAELEQALKKAFRILRKAFP